MNRWAGDGIGVIFPERIMVLRFIAFALVLLLLTPGSVLSAFEPGPKARQAVSHDCKTAAAGMPAR